MVLRILCLHGMGVNADIFALQTGKQLFAPVLDHETQSRVNCPAASIRATLPSTYDFFFVDGPAVCDAAPSVGEVFAGPYRCWYNTPTMAKVSAAHDFVRGVMEKEGPFDGVMGFSQVRK